MQNYGRIFRQYWTSPDIKGKSIDTKCLGAYLLSCQHGNMIGCFRLPIAYVIDDLDMGSATVSKGFQDLCDSGFLAFDPNLSWVLIRKYLRWNPIENPNQGKAAAKLVEQVPQNSTVFALLVGILRENPANFPDGFLNRFETVPEPLLNQQQQQQQQTQPQLQPQKLARSVPPEELAGTLPLVDGSNYAVSISQVAEWSQAYPAIDVRIELKKFKSWLDANPTRKKTAKGICRAIVNWLSRAQDRAPGNGSNSIATSSRNTNIEALRQSLAADQDSLDADGDATVGETRRGYAFPLLVSPGAGAAR